MGTTGRLAIILLLPVFVALAFIAGRFTSAPPQFEPSDSEGDELRAAFEDFQRAQRETLALMETREPFNDPQMQAEAYRGLLYTIVGSIKAAGLVEHDFPRFMRAVDWTSKAGLDNPDNNYYFAMLRDDAEYRIRATRGTTRNLIFQLVVGQPGVRGAGSSTNVSVVDADDLEIAPDGSFELIVSREDPGPDSNWLRSGEGAEALLVRFTHSDWANEREGTLTIERIGAEGEQRPLLTPASMAASLREVAVHMYDRTATWMDFADKAWMLRARNSITAARPSRGGLVGQYSAFGNWELSDDEALVLRTFPSTASYQGIELGNRWFVSLDYETRTSSMTLNQAHRASDGSYYFVISARDPGVANWLDTESHQQGLIMLRWQGLQGELDAAQQPTMQLVPFDKLFDHLPPDTPRVTAGQRAEQIRARRMAVQQRFGR
jgi:hypothetical protein